MAKLKKSTPAKSAKPSKVAAAKSVKSKSAPKASAPAKTKPAAKNAKVSKPIKNTKDAKNKPVKKNVPTKAAPKKAEPIKAAKKATPKAKEVKKPTKAVEVKKTAAKSTKPAKPEPKKEVKTKTTKPNPIKFKKPSAKPPKEEKNKAKSKKSEDLIDEPKDDLEIGDELPVEEISGLEEAGEDLKGELAVAIPTIVIENDEDDEDFPKPKKSKKDKKDKAKKAPKRPFVKKEIIVIGHRGNSSHFPENTIEAITSCFHLNKVIGAEFDVQMTKDGDFVVFHDDDTSRFSDNKIKISSASYSELKKIDVGGWFDQKYHNTPMPLLDDVMAVLTHNNPNFFYNIEIKKSPFIRGELVKTYMNRLFTQVDSWVDPKRVLFTSFDWECLDYLRHNGQDVRLGVLTDQPDERGWISKVKQLNAEFIVVPMSKIDSELMDIVKTELETGVVGYTEFNYDQKQEELDLVEKVKVFNISGLIVNYPEEVKAIVG